MPKFSQYPAQNSQQVTVFLDSNVLIQYQEGRLDWLFSPAALRRFHYAINSVVLQELLLQGAPARHPERLEIVQQQTELLPINLDRVNALLPRARELRNRFVHSNDILILSSAKDCDYFVSDDKSLFESGQGSKPKVLTSTDLQQLLEDTTEA